VVNLHARDDVDVSIDVEGFETGNVSAQVLTGNAIDAHNTFEKPDTVRPANLAVSKDGSAVRATLPARSVSVLRFAAR
jgi:alpha-N-arabinofuranosidase